MEIKGNNERQKNEQRYGKEGMNSPRTVKDKRQRRQGITCK
jgi:hypothetical protein